MVHTNYIHDMVQVKRTILIGSVLSRLSVCVWVGVESGTTVVEENDPGIKRGILLAGIHWYRYTRTCGYYRTIMISTGTHRPRP